jgi:predicted DNA-binding ribbon-helix-helix protein
VDATSLILDVKALPNPENSVTKQRPNAHSITTMLVSAQMAILSQKKIIVLTLWATLTEIAEMLQLTTLQLYLKVPDKLSVPEVSALNLISLERITSKRVLTNPVVLNIIVMVVKLTTS